MPRTLTEERWLTCDQPSLMIRHLIRHLGYDPRKRKLTLLSAACLRRVWDWLFDPRSRHAVEVAEQFADGCATEAELRTVREAARQYGLDSSTPIPREPHSKVYYSAGEAAWRDHISDVHPYAADATAWCQGETQVAITAPEEQAQVQLIRDIFGNPFRPVRCDPSGQTPTIVSLAQAAYDERALPSGHLDPNRLGVLGDVLEEPGCADQTILDHLRGPGPHVRACWPVDLILGKG
jgi:hypothetical protein